MSESYAMDEHGGSASSRGYSHSSAYASRLSSVAVESADVVLDERKMYAVEWREGDSFGFTVTPINSDRGTVLLLVRRTAQRAQLEAAGLQDVVPGDILVGVGDEKVYHLGVENAAKYIRSVQKPVRLTLQLSPYGNAAKTLPDLAPNEYNYLWEDGPLGIVLTYDLKSKLPMVKRLSDKANDVVRRDVEVGDQLMYANDVPSSEYSMDEVMAMLREMPKPVLLRFRKQLADDHLVELPELAGNEYEFLWDYGPLGLVIGMSRSGLPFVRSFTGLGTSRQLPLVHQDDEIVMVNDRSARDEGFREIMQYLMNVPKPAVLRFRRRMPGEEERASAETPRSSAQQQRGSSMHQQQQQQQQDGSRSSSGSQKQQDAPAKSLPSPVEVSAPIPSYPTPPMHGQPPPPSPQVHVPLDRSRFSTQSVGYGVKMDARSSVASSEDYNRSTTSSARPSNGFSNSYSNVRSTTSSEQLSAFDEAANDPRTTETVPFAEDRETAILPTDPRANNLGNQSRSSIFSFRFDDGPQEIMTGPTVGGAAPPKERRLSVKTGSVPAMSADPEPTEDRRSTNGSLGRSQSSRMSRPNSNGQEAQPLPLVIVPDTSSKLSGSRVGKQYPDAAESGTQPARTSVNNQRDHEVKPAVAKARATPTSNQFEDTSELVADPVPKPQQEQKTKSYIDTAELFAEPTPAPVAKAAPAPAPAPVLAPAPVKKTIVVGKKVYEDTAELFAEPAKPTPPPAVKKPIVDTAELEAEPVKNPLASSQIKKPVMDTASLVAEPPKQVKPAAPAPVTAVSPPTSSSPPAPVEGQEFFKIDENAFYTVQWTDGPFGSTVREAESSDGPVMLITKRTGKQTCAGLRRIAVGDILVRIGENSISAMGFEKATRYLRKVPKPVPLTFQAID